MPNLVYSLSGFSNTNRNLTGGGRFSFSASGSTVSNAYVTGGTLYLSSIKTFGQHQFHLKLTFGGTEFTTATFPGSDQLHSETVSLSGLSNALLSKGSGTIEAVIMSSIAGDRIFLANGLTGQLVIEYAYNYTACAAPTTVSVNANNVAPGAGVTLSWSGAKAGSSNAIKQYQIYRATSAAGSYSLLTTINSTATSGSVAVTAPTVNSAAYYYKVLTVGTVSGYNSGMSSAYATLACSFSAPGAPGTVTIGGGTATYALPGANVTLAWSGAKAGTNNAIKGYIIYRNGVQYTTVSSTATSGSLSVPAHSTAGSSYNYAVYTQGTYSNSGVSASRYVYTYSAPGAPTAVSISATLAAAGAAVTLSWSGAAAGSYNAISGYDIYRATAAGGTYTLLTSVSSTAASGSCAANASATAGASYFYKVVTKGTRSNSALSSAHASVKTNTAPPAPTIAAPTAGKTTYNPRPLLLITLGTDADGQTQTLTASGYAASSTGSLPADRRIVLRRSAALTAAGSQTVSVTATDALGAASAVASRSFTYAVPAFTDALSVGNTPIRVAHINELRAMVDTARGYYGLTAYAWAMPVVAGTTSLAHWTSHVLELRTAMREVADHINGWDAASTTNNIILPEWIGIPVNRPSVAVMNQLREAISLL